MDKLVLQLKYLIIYCIYILIILLIININLMKLVLKNFMVIIITNYPEDICYMFHTF